MRLAIKTAFRTGLDNILRYALAYDTEPTEWLTSLGLVVYGFTLLLPVSTFATYGKVLRTLLESIPETLVGLVFLTIGVFGIVALVWRITRFRHIAMMATAIVYLFIFLFFLYFSGASTSNIFIVFAGGSAWSYLRLKGVLRKNGHE